MGPAARIVARNRGLPPGRDSLLSSRRMATTHSTEPFQPVASWDTPERRYEARAVTLEAQRYAARRAARREAWGIHPLLAWACITLAALALAVISWVTGGIVDSYDDPGKGVGYVVPESEPAEPVPLTTTTGTTVELDP